MDQLFLTLFCMYGIMFTLRSAQLPGLAHIRDWLSTHSSLFRKLFDCSFCSGFHAGWLTYVLLNHNLFEMQPWLDSACYLAVYSFTAAAWCYFLDTVIVKLES